jgi:GH24 family phage-related lysozyme (muramidase)
MTAIAATPPSSRGKKLATAAALAAAIATPAEGLRQLAYYDPPGILTVCRGHTGPDVVKGRKYSLAECDAFMTEDMRKAVTAVDRCQPGLPVEVLAAFADATFNMGPTIACNRTRSTAARMLYAGDLVNACNQLPRWNKASVGGVMVALPGLTKRRAAERELCLKGAQ